MGATNRLAVLALCTCAGDRVNPAGAWKKLVVEPAFRSEGVAVFDVDRDGRADIVTEQFWYRAPEFTPNPIRANAQPYDPETEYSQSFAVFGGDVDRDGWTDAIVVGFPGAPAVWYRNPHDDSTPWTSHVITDTANVETPIWADLFGDGRHELVLGIEATQTLAWLEPAGDPTAPWTVHPISAPGFFGAARFAHGLGAGDVDGDGIVDILTSEGWFRGPMSSSSPTWKPFLFHSNECAEMYVWDVNGDRLPDVISSNPHHYGVWWWEQNAAGTFTEHVIDDSFSESHAMRVDDLDGDGVPEIITGKRFYSHGKNEKGALDPAVVVIYRRSGSGFVREVIDDASGVGTQFEIADVTGDGRPDIVTSNKHGLFRFAR